MDIAAASWTSRAPRTLVGVRCLGVWDGAREVLRPARRLLIFSSVVTLALNVVFTPDPGQLCSSPK
jgi:hypothetical protein